MHGTNAESIARADVIEKELAQTREVAGTESTSVDAQDGTIGHLCMRAHAAQLHQELLRIRSRRESLLQAANEYARARELQKPVILRLASRIDDLRS